MCWLYTHIVCERKVVSARWSSPAPPATEGGIPPGSDGAAGRRKPKNDARFPLQADICDFLKTARPNLEMAAVIRKLQASDAPASVVACGRGASMREGCCLARLRGAGLLCNHACRVPEAQPGPIRIFLHFLLRRRRLSGPRQRRPRRLLRRAARRARRVGAARCLSCLSAAFQPPATRCAPRLLVPASFVSTPGGCQPAKPC